jgi:hypothetical protein
VKVQKNEILIKLERQLPTHIAHYAKAPQAIATNNALSKSAINPLIIFVTFVKSQYLCNKLLLNGK